jgi:hypothetical protein
MRCETRSLARLPGGVRTGEVFDVECPSSRAEYNFFREFIVSETPSGASSLPRFTNAPPSAFSSFGLRSALLSVAPDAFDVSNLEIREN